MHDGTFDPKQLIPASEREEAVTMASNACVEKQKESTEDSGESSAIASVGNGEKVKDKSGRRSRSSRSRSRIRSRRPDNDSGSISNGMQ
jgi:hypothetical protein